MAGARCYYQQLWSKHANFEYSDTLLEPTVYEHSSLLKFIERVFDLPTLASVNRQFDSQLATIAEAWTYFGWGSKELRTYLQQRSRLHGKYSRRMSWITPGTSFDMEGSIWSCATTPSFSSARTIQTSSTTYTATCTPVGHA